MTLQVYRYSGTVTPSIVRAQLVAEIEADEIPTDQITFAQEQGGDFIELAEDVWQS